MNISIDEHGQELIKRKIESGDYGSPEEVVEKALALLDERDKKLDALRKDIQLGIDQADKGQLTPASEVFDELKRRNSKLTKRRG